MIWAEDGSDIEGESQRLFAPEEKFANPRDHMGRTAVDVRRLCDKTAECKCPVCAHRLVVRSGEKVAVHFAHAPGRKDTACKGGFETPWHVAAKRAAGSQAGWLDEFTDGEWRYDACNQWTGEVFEAVHSLSSTYVAKQRHLSSLGRPCKWLFDSAGDFQNSNLMPLDIDKACGGLLECYDLLKPKAVDVIEELGRERCFLHYLGLAWKCVGVDRWQVCPAISEVQLLCTGEHGLNRMLIEFRARGDIPQEKTAFRNGDLVSTAWREISAVNLLQSVQERRSQLIETWRRNKAARERLRRRANKKVYRPTTEDDLANRNRPVCEMLAELRLQEDQVESLNAICDEIGQPTSAAIAPDNCDPLARIHRTWREYCRAGGWLKEEDSDGR